MEEKHPGGQSRISKFTSFPSYLRTSLMELFDIGPWVALTVLAFASLVILAAGVYFFQSAPPRAVTITTGPENSIGHRQALRYARVLEKNGVRATVIPSLGSVENLERLKDPKSGVSLGLVQTGVTALDRRASRTERGETASDLNPDHADLVSLGSVAYQPVLIFYRGEKVEYLSALQGKRIAVGPKGSGTRNIALALLDANGIKEGEASSFFDVDAEEAARMLEAKQLDAAFVMGESASGKILRTLMRSGSVRLFSFKQASAYTRKFDYLNPLELPEGSIDLGANLPASNVTLLAPTTELIAREDLHPALIGLVIEAATSVHARPGMFQKRGEFPAPIEHSIRLSDDALVYYKSGKSFLYRHLPFWLASLLSRLFFAIVPVLVILIPMIRAVPAFFQWVAKLRIRKRYRELRLIEQAVARETDPARKESFRKDFDRVAEEVNRMKVRAAFADQYYGLRWHIDYVRRGMRSSE